MSERVIPNVSLKTLRVFRSLRVLDVSTFPTSDLSTESRSVNPYKLHSPSTLVGGEQNRPANPWRHDAKHVSPHLTWQIIPPQRASKKGRRKPSVSEMTSVRFSQSQCYACVLYASAKLAGGIERSRPFFARGWHLPSLRVGGTFRPLPSAPSVPHLPSQSEERHCLSFLLF